MGNELRLAILVRRAGRSLREVEEESGLSAATLSRIERGRSPSLLALRRLVEWLNVPADEVLRALGGEQQEESDAGL